MKAFFFVVMFGLAMLFLIGASVVASRPPPPPPTPEQSAARQAELAVLYRECRLTPVSQMTVATTNKCNDRESILRIMDRQRR